MEEVDRVDKVQKVIATLLLGCVLAVIAAVSANAQAPAPAAAQPAAPAGDVETGRKLFVSVGCWQCHGYEAQGGAAGPRLAARNMPYAALSAYVRKPTNQMPLYTEKVLSNADLGHIYAFVRSRPAPKPADSIPLLAK